jgi:hypothetical protein
MSRIVSRIMSQSFWGRRLFMSKHAQTCPNQSPPDVYSIAVMTQSSSKVGNLLTGQISHDNFHYGQIVLLNYRKVNSKRFRLYARPKFPGFDRGSGYSFQNIALDVALLSVHCANDLNNLCTIKAK